MAPADALGPLVTLYSVLLGGIGFVLRRYSVDGTAKIAPLVAVIGSAFAGVGVLAFLYTIGEAGDQKLFIFS